MPPKAKTSYVLCVPELVDGSIGKDRGKKKRKKRPDLYLSSACLHKAKKAGSLANGQTLPTAFVRKNLEKKWVPLFSGSEDAKQ